jgi:hypothetical protein
MLLWCNRFFCRRFPNGCLGLRDLLKNSCSMQPVQQQPLEENSPQEATIVRLTLHRSQAKQFWSLLEEALNRTGIHGVLCTVNRFQDLNAGHLFLELQAGRLDGATTRKIQQLILESRNKPKQTMRRRYKLRTNYARLWRN